MKELKFIEPNGNEIITTIPEKWEEVTVKQFVDLELSKWDGKDVVELLAILGGVVPESLNNTTSKVYDALRSAVEFIMIPAPDFAKLKKAKHITINGKQVKVPKNITFESFGQAVHIRQLMEREQGETLTTSIPEACAIYLQPHLDEGQFDPKRLEAVQAEIMEMSIMDMYPLANFFFRRFKENLQLGVIGLTLFR